MFGDVRRDKLREKGSGGGMSRHRSNVYDTHTHTGREGERETEREREKEREKER